jgi:hypothetical protein
MEEGSGRGSGQWCGRVCQGMSGYVRVLIGCGRVSRRVWQQSGRGCFWDGLTGVGSSGSGSGASGSPSVGGQFWL